MPVEAAVVGDGEDGRSGGSAFAGGNEGGEDEQNEEKDEKDHHADEADNEDEEKDILGLQGSLAWLALITVGVSMVSSVMVSAIKGAADQYGMSSVFICVRCAFFNRGFHPRNAFAFHAFARLDASMGVAKGIPLEWSLLLPVGTVNCVQTLKAILIPMGGNATVLSVLDCNLRLRTANGIWCNRCLVASLQHQLLSYSNHEPCRWP
jgi:hypothetical protein